MTAGDKVRAVYGMALKGYWVAKTRDSERQMWRIVMACKPGQWLKPE